MNLISPSIICVLLSWIFCCGFFEVVSSSNPCDAKNCTFNVSCNINPINPNQCLCLQGHKGDNCEDIDECSMGKHDPCGHRGICTNTQGSYRCDCLQGWTAPENHCSVRTKDNVTCLPGYHGENCTITECGNGYAVSTNASAKSSMFTCICDRGWKNTRPQDACNIDIDECLVNTTCLRGNCSNTVGNYTCNCDDHWHGRHCDFYDICKVQICNGTNTVCNKTGAYNDTTLFKCVCKVGWGGMNCTKAISTTTLTTPTLVETTSGQGVQHDDVGGASSVPAIAGGAIGGIAAIAAGVVVAIFVYRNIMQRKVGNKDDSTTEEPRADGSMEKVQNTNNVSDDSEK